MSVSVHDVVLVIIPRMHFLTFPGYCNLCNFDRIRVLLVNVRVILVVRVLLVVILVAELLVLLMIVIRVLRVSPQVIVGSLRIRHEVLQVLRVMHYGGNVLEALVLELDFRCVFVTLLLLLNVLKVL